MGKSKLAGGLAVVVGVMLIIGDCLLPFLQCQSSVQIFGFDDFCYDEVCYDNPARDVARWFGGAVVAVDSDAVEALEITGAALGIGVDPSATGAYVNGSALGLGTLAAAGPDAGDYECGHLYAGLLEENQCSLFMHLPPEPTLRDLAAVVLARRDICACVEQH